jgi:hypothetical protein
MFYQKIFAFALLGLLLLPSSAFAAESAAGQPGVLQFAQSVSVQPGLAFEIAPAAPKRTTAAKPAAPAPAPTLEKEFAFGTSWQLAILSLILLGGCIYFVQRFVNSEKRLVLEAGKFE